MKSIKLLIVLVLLSFASKAVAQDPRLIDAAKRKAARWSSTAHRKHLSWTR